MTKVYTDAEIAALLSGPDWRKSNGDSGPRAIMFGGRYSDEADIINDLRAIVAQQAETIRRAQLLTPESVRATCEREGFDWNHDRGDLGMEDGRSVGVSGCERGAAWNVCRRVDGLIDTDVDCLTVGQLEDAIAAAKEGR